ncbi:PAS domain S-box protein [Inhella gelatinilytica]|uniref:Virulence sensor protein BvgS n=1 Tax=Inhella gelatinilytica TaxID=2795030 RepID=A0A931IYX9_9BURK|nr:PAS domain S-box protein [Inhella gelatinilytica]MBH9554171.1 PAS domain S-box protein [Inhella gelatinilytica]
MSFDLKPAETVPRPVWTRALRDALTALLLVSVVVGVGSWVLWQHKEMGQSTLQRAAGEAVQLDWERRLAQVHQVLATVRVAAAQVPGTVPNLDAWVQARGLDPLPPGMQSLEWVSLEAGAELAEQSAQFVSRSAHPAGRHSDHALAAQMALRRLLIRAAGSGQLAVGLGQGADSRVWAVLPLMARGEATASTGSTGTPARAWVLMSLEPKQWLKGLGGGTQASLALELRDDGQQPVWGQLKTTPVEVRALPGLPGWTARLGPAPPPGSPPSAFFWLTGAGVAVLAAALAGWSRWHRERGQARSELRTAQFERMSQVAQYTQQAVFNLDRNGRIEWANAAAQTLAEAALPALMGQTLGDALQLPAGGDRSAIEAAVKEHQGWQVRDLETLDRRGHVRWLDVEISAVEASDLGAVVLVLDQTDRRNTAQRLEAAVREHNDWLGTIQQHLLVAETDLAGRLLQVNEAFCALTGYSRAELVGSLFSMLDSRRHPPGFWSQVWQQLLAGKTWSGPICNRRKDGSLFWVNSVLAPISGADGRSERYLALSFDITASRAAQDQLQSERERFNAIIEGTQAGTWEWNYQTGEWQVNARFAAMLGETGRTEPGVGPVNWMQRLHPDDGERVRDALMRHLNGVQPHFQVEARVRHAQGHWVWVSIRGMVVSHTPQGQPLRLAGTAFDISERRHAEDMLRVRQVMLDRTERLARVGGFELSLQDNRLTWTDQVFRIHGMSPGKQPSLEQALAYVRADDVDRLKQAMSEAVQEAAAWDLELGLTDAFGKTIWVRSVGEAEFDDSGPLRIVGAYQDITHEREMQAQAEQERAWMQSVLENLPCGLIVFDRELKLKTTNLEFQRLLDLPTSLMLPGQTTLHDLQRFNLERGDYGDGPEAAETADRYLAYSQAEAPHHFERTRPNGMTLDVRGTPLPGGGLVTTYIDISEAKRAQELMRSQERFLRLVADAVPGRIAYWTRRLRCVFANRGYFTWCGWTPERMLGCTMEDVFGAAFVEAERPRLEAVLRGEVQNFERMESFQDTTRTMLVHYVPDIQEGEVRGFVVLALDISELKAEQRRAEALNAELAVERDRANEASVAKSQFLANMSHEIRTPMNAILGMLKLLRRTALDARQADYADRSEGAARSLLGLLNDILDFSKVEAGKMVLDPHPFQVDDLLRNLAVILASNVGRKPVELVLYVDPRVPAGLVGDAMRLQQVLINLGGNAVKFTEQGDVVVSVRRVADLGDRVRLEFSVRDSGIGIAEDKQASIFSGFTQAEASTTRRFGGTGLGLAISQRLVQAMGGGIDLQSQLGRGSRFSFSLELPVVVEAEPPAVSHHWRVLVVDDNPVAVAALEAMAEGLGWQALAAPNLQDAQTLWQVEMDEGRPVHAVLVDNTLATPDGLAWLRAVRQDSKAGAERVIAMGMGTLPEREQLSAHGRAGDWDGFLIKPITAGVLAETLSVARSHGPSSAPAARAQRLRGVRLLVVEDNPTNRQVAQELLEDEGALITLAEHGGQALDCLVEQRFDLVLMDMQMPVMDGLTATRAIRNELRLTDLPIVAMTANASPADRAECLAAGMNDHVGKPFELDALVRLIARMTEGRVQTEATPVAAAQDEPAPALPAVAAVDPQLRAEGLAAGIDLQAAMERFMGKTELYLRMCRSFERSARVLPAQLREMTGDDRHEAARHALHSFKGLAATLAADELAKWGKVGEDRAKAGEDLDPAWVQELAGVIDSGLGQLLRLAQALHEPPVPVASEPAETPAARADKAELPRGDEEPRPLQVIRAAVDAGDYAVLTLVASHRAELEAALGDRLEALDEALAALDFEAARRALS